MVEITEQDIIDMKKGFQTMNQTLSGVDLSNLASKKEMELCIGAECDKLSGSINDVKKSQEGLQGRVDHIDDLVHQQVKRYQAPPRAAHEAAQRKAAQDDKHAHNDMKAMADCPDCYPGMEAAVEPKLLAKGYRKEAFIMSEQARNIIRSKGIPGCDKCGVPWLADTEGKVADKCVNCGEGIDDGKSK